MTNQSESLEELVQKKKIVLAEIAKLPLCAAWCTRPWTGLDSYKKGERQKCREGNQRERSGVCARTD
mgnify:CR=1 FL=1